MRTLFLSLSLTALLLGGAGCTYSGPSAPSSEAPRAAVAFDTPATFTIGESITFQDGMVLKLTAINDSRCKPDVQCIWAGELSPVFVLYDINQSFQEFTLGTVRAAKVTVRNYVITLKNATTDQVTITVSKK
jgi:hypothetical protein